MVSPGLNGSASQKNQQIIWPQKFGSLRQPTQPVRDLNRAKFLFAFAALAQAL
jgi:hypothetical protein